ncbi:hypothetical protein NCLIV_004900 [Neospora caninum Liverpool]|uniref:Autophagy protein Apg6, related n=1 Tax=Neospora caninum (strain Liverpool) TaxID=572307 RepID=F0V8H3_NEOCL|nr:hypothetical protein NCLIV_004900 [Neospora caninum Liverpool]CBZ50014.1 hypothetical protein NCLIV_004900 [Neospora caninum Liverpool]CEL64604.1 TPA: Autophagy protein Apg6, related [Neospora caninum Liverpool]|eukprot:XP_003880049.1 hypothetical protein NCLIV_004900 [Neospora caninum Liverpool]
MMGPSSMHRCVDCAAPLVVVHDAIPPACLLPVECSARGLEESSRQTRRTSSSSSSVTGIFSAPQTSLVAAALKSDHRNPTGDEVKVSPRSLPASSTSPGVCTPPGQRCASEPVQASDAVPASSCAGASVSLSSPRATRAPSGESGYPPSLQDSFVLLSPLPGTQAPSSHHEKVVPASSPTAAMNSEAQSPPAASPQARAPCGMPRQTREEEHRQQFVARLNDGENWTQLVLDDAALCEKCFSSTMGELEKQLEEERALLRQYTRALEKLKKLRGETARRGQQETAESARGSRKRDSGTQREVQEGVENLSAKRDGPQLDSWTAKAPEGAQKREDVSMPSLCRQEGRTTREETGGGQRSPLHEGRRDGKQERKEENQEEHQRLRLAQDLLAAQQEYEDAEDEEEELLEEVLTLNLLQRRLWHLSSAHQGRVARQEEATAAMLRQREYVSEQLERLKQLNVMNDAFHIWTDGALPSINSCRIGRLSSPASPSWAEINSGWGHMCLLLDVLFRKVYVHPTHYRLLPRGPYSCLIRRKDDTVLPLQGGGKETGLSRFFYKSRRFDEATVAFLECVQELHEALVHFARQPWPPYASPGVQTPWEPPELPFAVESDRVGGLSIRLQMSQDERWTKAVKYLLIDLKWLLSYVERVCVVCPSSS